MGPIWDRDEPGGPHVGPMNFAIWVATNTYNTRFLNIYPKLDHKIDPFLVLAINIPENVDDAVVKMVHLLGNWV